MKKLILILIFILCSDLVFGQITEAPQYQFQSTSSYKYTEINRQYTIPVSEIQQPFTSSSPYRPRIAEGDPYNPSDPGWEDVPIGDAFIPLMIFSALYVLVKMYRVSLNK